jgi:hypothetical protein
VARRCLRRVYLGGEAVARFGGSVLHGHTGEARAEQAEIVLLTEDFRQLLLALAPRLEAAVEAGLQQAELRRLVLQALAPVVQGRRRRKRVCPQPTPLRLTASQPSAAISGLGRVRRILCC